MSEVEDRRIAALCGLLGAALIGLEGLLDLARTLLALAFDRGRSALLPFDQGVVLVVLSLVIAIFSVLGGLRREGRPVAAGAVLLVLVVVGWLELGLGSGLFALLGAVLALVGGVVFLASGR